MAPFTCRPRTTSRTRAVEPRMVPTCRFSRAYLVVCMYGRTRVVGYANTLLFERARGTRPKFSIAHVYALCFTDRSHLPYPISCSIVSSYTYPSFIHLFCTTVPRSLSLHLQPSIDHCGSLSPFPSHLHFTVSSLDSAMATVDVHPPPAEPAPVLPDYLTDPDAVLNDSQAKWRYGRAPDYSKTRKVFAESECCVLLPANFVLNPLPLS